MTLFTAEAIIFMNRKALIFSGIILTLVIIAVFYWMIYDLGTTGFFEGFLGKIILSIVSGAVFFTPIWLLIWWKL